MFRHNSPAARFKVPLLFHLIASGELPWSVLIRCIDNVVVIFTKRRGIMVLEWVNSLKMELVVDLYLHIMTRRSKRTNEFTTKFHNTTLRYSTDSQQWLWKGGETKFYFWWWGATHWDLSHSSAYHIKVRFLAPKVGQIRAGLETRMKLVVEDPVMGKVSRFYLRTLSSNRLKMFIFSSFFNRCFYHLYFCSKSRYIIAI